MKACIPSRAKRRAPIPQDATLYRKRHKIEIMFARLKDWRRHPPCRRKASTISRCSRYNSRRGIRRATAKWASDHPESAIPKRITFVAPERMGGMDQTRGANVTGPYGFPDFGLKPICSPVFALLPGYSEAAYDCVSNQCSHRYYTRMKGVRPTLIKINDLREMGVRVPSSATNISVLLI